MVNRRKILKPAPHQIVAWVKKHFSNHKTAQGGKQLRINNPFDGDRGFHLWINIDLGLVHDFRPRHKKVDGTFLWFVKKYRKISFNEAVREVIGEVGNENYTYYIPKDSGPKQRINLPDGFKYLTDSNSIILEPIYNYLHFRKITDDQIKSNKIGYSGFDVVFPYFEDGDIVYWQSRNIMNKTFRFPENTNKSDFIYGYDDIEPGEPIILTESIFNAMMFDRGVAIGGSSLGSRQVAKLRKRGVKELILALDNDSAGRMGIAKCFDLRNYFSVFYSLSPDYDKDWNDLAIEEGRKSVNNIMSHNIKKLTFSESVRLKIK